MLPPLKKDVTATHTLCSGLLHTCNSVLGVMSYNSLVISPWGRGLFLSEFPLPYTIFPKSSQIIWLTLGHLLNYLDCLASPWKFWWSSSKLRPRNLVVSTSIPGDPYHQARLGNSGPACSNTKNMWLSELKKLHVNRTFFCLFRSDNHQINIVL